MLRIAADFDNWKKRARRDQADGEMHAKESVLRDFLEIVDSLERATIVWADGKEIDAKSVRDGVELVLRQFRSKLERYDVKPMEATGVRFDPRMHEAVSQVPSATVTPGSCPARTFKRVTSSVKNCSDQPWSSWRRHRRLRRNPCLIHFEGSCRSC